MRFGICIIACSYDYDYCQCHPVITCLLLKKLYWAVSFDIHDVPEKNDPKVFFVGILFWIKQHLGLLIPSESQLHVLVVCLLHDDLAFIPVSVTHWKDCECYQLSSVVVVLNSFVVLVLFLFTFKIGDRKNFNSRKTLKNT